MSDNKDNNALRTIILSAICIPVIIWLLYNAYQKNQQSGVETTACSTKCTAQGFAGYDFKWSVFAGPKCTCLNAPS